MRFVSTRGKAAPVSFGEALFAGLAPDGGLYFPSGLEPLPRSFLSGLRTAHPREIARDVAVHLLGGEIPPHELAGLTEESLDFPIPLRPIQSGVGALELFHGPTLAFKDVGARFMARVMSWFRRGEEEEIVVLVATSGDTGSAVAHAFFGRPGFRVVVLFPQGQISEAQQKLFTTLGGNVDSLAVSGTFDDCQRLVKRAFGDRELRRRRALASANSINVGRLLPQIFYYFMAAAQLPEERQEAVFSTPSGNFGNLTAGLFAKRLGLRASLFVAATNVNDVVPEYLETGLYHPRPSRRTLSSAMDVGNPSNFERILHLYDHDLGALRRDLIGSRHTDAEVLEAIRTVHREHGYVLDPHSAVGYLALAAGRERRPGDYAIFLATAHPAKFLSSVRDALGITIEVPPALAGPLARDETVVPIGSEYGELREFLWTTAGSEADIR